MLFCLTSSIEQASSQVLTTGLAAATLVGAAAFGLTSIAAAPTTGIPASTPVVFGAPLPLDQAPDISGQLMHVLTTLEERNVSFRSPGKENLIQGGVGIIEGRTADRALENAYQDGSLPVSFNVTNIRQAADGSSATATISVSGGQGQPRSQDVTFVSGGPLGWQLSRSSALAVLTAFACAQPMASTIGCAVFTARL